MQLLFMGGLYHIGVGQVKCNIQYMSISSHYDTTPWCHIQPYDQCGFIGYLKKRKEGIMKGKQMKQLCQYCKNSVEERRLGKFHVGVLCVSVYQNVVNMLHLVLHLSGDRLQIVRKIHVWL